jgi:hypothetical protein
MAKGVHSTGCFWYDGAGQNSRSIAIIRSHSSAYSQPNNGYDARGNFRNFIDRSYTKLRPLPFIKNDL